MPEALEVGKGELGFGFPLLGFFWGVLERMEGETVKLLWPRLREGGSLSSAGAWSTALASAGVTFQGTLRKPLETHLLGISTRRCTAACSQA